MSTSTPRHMSLSQMQEDFLTLPSGEKADRYLSLSKRLYDGGEIGLDRHLWTQDDISEYLFYREHMNSF